MENPVTTTKSTNEETSAIKFCPQCKSTKALPALWCRDLFHQTCPDCGYHLNAETLKKMKISRLNKFHYDPVNHPSHYTKHPSGIECIQVTEHMNFNLGNAVKYIWRCQDKNGIEDLEKAIWYIKREIERLNRD